MIWKKVFEHTHPIRRDNGARRRKRRIAVMPAFAHSDQDRHETGGRAGTGGASLQGQSRLAIVDDAPEVGDLVP